MGRRYLLVIGSIALLLAVGGLASSARALDFLNPPTSAITPTPSATPADANEPSPSLGLGNTRESIERTIGKPTGLTGTMLAYAGGKVAVTYQQGRATGVLVNFGKDHATLDTARGQVQAMLPSDRILIGTMAAGANRVADVYQSTRLGSTTSLATPSPSPGQFVVVYEDDGTGRIRDALLVIGGIPTS
jgi:hypothetical protein